MIILRLLKLELMPSVEILNTSWQVSSHPDFIPGTIVAESLEDPVNIYNISFDKKLEQDIKYYARAMQMLSTGPTKLSEVEYFYAHDINEVLLEIDTPSTIDVPIVETNYNFNQHPTQCFLIDSSIYSAIGNSKLKAITCLIEDSENKTVYVESNIKDQVKKYTLSKPLPLGKVFNIKLQHLGTNNDVSQMGSHSIYTSFDPRIKYLYPVIDYDIQEPLYLEIESIIGMTQVEWILRDSNGDVVWEQIDMEIGIIPVDVFEIGECYVLGAQITVNGKKGDWDFKYFIADPAVNNPPLILPEDCHGTLPYGLGGCKLGGGSGGGSGDIPPGEDECVYGYPRVYSETCYGNPIVTPPEECVYGYPRDYNGTCYGEPT